MLLATLIHRASLPCPQVGPDQAAQLLEQHYGLAGTLQSLGSQQDLNYKVDSPRGRAGTQQRAAATPGSG